MRCLLEYNLDFCCCCRCCCFLVVSFFKTHTHSSVCLPICLSIDIICLFVKREKAIVDFSIVFFYLFVWAKIFDVLEKLFDITRYGITHIVQKEIKRSTLYLYSIPLRCLKKDMKKFVELIINILLPAAI